ncbi:uncharacterized protein LACBIDRAFT_308002 [Laccaria bicolor S238N-H82]|uniref:Predicted protein n=1 Tax=Laccaria bicolor (strain S238N-H82 / ATCC MYA-4686) TaxID=486041 RepID=B0DRE0_LACBS|nr:uncharacterized protein LACBIDRAFT_308002 [Laccaria bicolor S238N-H82]EDR02853.1 predicted protein [Laccaria bicolor S238N-H82]|eukprot:XP_001886563.1 predicted protein [Laccaria bicolor S238N-H82]
MLRSTTVAEHLDLDIGCYLVAHGIRRGLFKHHSSLESLLAGTEHWIQYKDEILEDAFFVQSTKRGLGIDPTKPMRDNNHREFMQRIGISVGLGGSESGVTSYAMRRNFATVIANHAGKDKARKAMAHKANSTTLETTYDDDIRRTDFVGLILGEAVESAWNMRQGHQPALNRLEKVAGTPLDQNELERRMPMLKILSQQAIDLKDCLAQGLADWKQVIVHTNVFLAHILS